MARTSRREVLTSAGAVEVTAPRVNDRRTDADTGQRARFSSVILPPWCRKTPKITEVLPLLYLHGLSTGDFVPALGQFLGSSAGLSAPVITKLTDTWKAEQRAFAARDLSGVDYVYLWVDGIVRHEALHDLWGSRTRPRQLTCGVRRRARTR
jgi:transposase-like protein